MKKKKWILLFLVSFIILSGFFVWWKVERSSNEEENRKGYKEYVGLLERKEYKKAEDFVLQALKDEKAFRKLSKSKQSEIYSALGTLNFVQNKYLNGLDYYKQALPLADKENQIGIKLNIAIGYRMFGGYYTSIGYLMDILKEIELSKHTKVEMANHQVYTLINLAENYFQLDAKKEFAEIVRAIPHFIDERSVVKLEQHALYETLNILVQCHDNNLREAKAALVRLDKRLEQSHTNYYSELELYSLRAKAVYYDTIGQKDEAILYYVKATELAEKQGEFFQNQFFINQLLQFYPVKTYPKEHRELKDYYYTISEMVAEIRREDYNLFLDKNVSMQSSYVYQLFFIIFLLCVIAILIGVAIFHYRKSTKFQYLTKIDPLCNIYNRRYLEKQLKAQKGITSILMIDVDSFKAYNDYYGHQKGDEVIKEVASILKESCRHSDIVARYGGEEFCVVLTDVTKEQAMMVGRNMMFNLASAKMEHEQSAIGSFVTISIGVYTAYRSNQLKDSIHFADKALYYVKANGRNNIIHYEDIRKEGYNKDGENNEEISK